MSKDRISHGSLLSRWKKSIKSWVSVEPEDKEEIIECLHGAGARGILNNDAIAMIEGVLQVSELRARDIMIPRAQVVMLDRDETVDTILKTVVESAHSRFPVIGDERGDVVGMLLAKDLLAAMPDDRSRRSTIKDMLRPPVFVPESKRLDVLLREFRASRNHMAMVVDEYGGIAGVVTIEDVLEQIVGEIEDEHDFEDDMMLLKLRNNLFTVKALFPVDEFNSYFGTDFDEEEFDTMGGLVTGQFGHVPKRGESILIGQYRFEVIRADSRRLHLMRLRIQSPEIAEAEAV